MPRKTLSIRFAALSAIFAVTIFMTATRATAQTEKVLHGFNLDSTGPFFPFDVLIFDAAGNLYGTTACGGPNRCGGTKGGTVFELMPQTGGGWTEKTLHEFGSGKDGYNLYAGLIFDADGNLYSTTCKGGAYDQGTVFELSPTSDGGWKEKILHAFNNNGKDGYCPQSGLVFDAPGNLYGTTFYGGSRENCTNGEVLCGTVFELSPTAKGGWAEKILHNFGNNEDGAAPYAGVIFDAAGNIYGTTTGGGNITQDCGSGGCGIAFELTKMCGGWTERILHRFGSGKDGFRPLGGLIFDASSNLYGATSGGGNSTNCDSVGCGTVFELMPVLGGEWTETLLYNFNGEDGAFPQAGLIFDASGNLYGTAGSGGATFGTAFELTPAGGVWNETLLWTFGLAGGDGQHPYGGLIFDAAGNLYGMTNEGGLNSGGTVFEITP
jgi:uncharacterized repeat protein (TIGR03803 family)